MPDPTPDPRATVELLTRLDAEMIGGEWYAVIAANQHPDFVEEVWDVETELSEDSTAFVAECGAIKCNKSRAHSHGIAALRNALPSIIRDLRRLAVLEERESNRRKMIEESKSAYVRGECEDVESLIKRLCDKELQDRHAAALADRDEAQRRLVEVEADNARLNEMAMNYQRLCDERYAKLGRDHDAAQRRLVEAEAELERTRVKLHCYVAAADAEATFANELNLDHKEVESELQRLRAALKPFADRAESLRQLASDLDSTEARVCGTQPVPVQHLIAAAEALAHREGQ